MKSTYLLLSLFALSVFVIFSCKKILEPEKQPVMTNPTSATEQRIRDFLDGTNQMKGEQTYTIEEAIWYCEASLNFTYAIYDSTFNFLSHETCRLSIDLNENSTVNENELMDAYEKLVDSLESHYDGILTTPKHVMICDVKYDGVTSGQLDISMISVIAFGTSPSPYGSFGPTDYWWSGDEDGKCNGYSGIGDATTALENKMNNTLVAPAENVRIYYTDIESVEYVNPEDYPYEYGPRGLRGYAFADDDPEAGVQCLPPGELNFYISNNGIPYIIDDNDTFEDLEFCEIDVIWDYLNDPNDYYEEHFYTLMYGERHETNISATDL